MHLSQPGIMAGRQAGKLVGWQVCRQADKTPVNFNFLEFAIDQLFAVFNKVSALLQQYESIQVCIFSISLF